MRPPFRLGATTPPADQGPGAVVCDDLRALSTRARSRNFDDLGRRPGAYEPRPSRWIQPLFTSARNASETTLLGRPSRRRPGSRSTSATRSRSGVRPRAWIARVSNARSSQEPQPAGGSSCISGRRMGGRDLGGREVGGCRVAVVRRSVALAFEPFGVAVRPPAVRAARGSGVLVMATSSSTGVTVRTGRSCRRAARCRSEAERKVQRRCGVPAAGARRPGRSPVCMDECLGGKAVAHG